MDYNGTINRPNYYGNNLWSNPVPVSNTMQAIDPAYSPQNSSEPENKFKIIKSIDDVYPNEIPQDGSWGIFVLEDLSKVYLMTCTINGIQRKEYVLYEEPEKMEPGLTREDVSGMLEEFGKTLRDEMKKMIDNSKRFNKGGTNNGK